MNKESLEKIREKAIEVIDKEDIPITDKVELLLNIYHFLDPEKYNQNIKALSIK